MATSEQIKALLRAHFENDTEKFKTVCLQIAAHEAKQGHGKLARDIKNLVVSPKYGSNIIKLSSAQTEFFEYVSNPSTLNDLVLLPELEDKIIRILKEYENREVLYNNGLANRRKLLLIGPPGTGKTMSASVIANEIDIPLYRLQMDKLVTKYMGETSIKLRKIFEIIQNYQGVYLFDEFDAIGADRTADNDVAEMRRVLNSFLQLLEQDNSTSIIVAATNNPQILDRALFRRFDDVLNYGLPAKEQITKLIKSKLGKAFAVKENVLSVATGLSFADISNACDNVLKESILFGSKATPALLIDSLKEKKNIQYYGEVN